MQPTISIDTRRWNELALSLSVALKKDAGEVLRDESRLFLKQCISFTPPRNKKQGENAIAQDILGGSKTSRGIVQPIKPYMEKSTQRNGYRVLFADKAGVVHAVEDANWKPGAGMDEIQRRHNASRGGNRNRVMTGRGYTMRGKMRMVQKLFTEESTIKSFLKSTFKKVGRLKAGWIPAFTRLGGKAASWIQRHRSGARGYVVDNSTNPTAPFIAMENHAAGVGETKRIVNNALRARQSAMARRLKLILSGYSADIAKGIRARSKARRTPSSATAK